MGFNPIARSYQDTKLVIRSVFKGIQPKRAEVAVMT